MKTSLLVAGTIAAATVPFIACTTNNYLIEGTSDGGTLQDSGPPALSGSDASNSDASDGATTDGGQTGGPVTFHAYEQSSPHNPIVGMHTYTADVAGHIVSQADTDSTGSVTLVVPSGGSLNVAGPISIYSYFDLTAGDVVRQFLSSSSSPPPPPPLDPPMGRISVSTTHTVDGASGYIVYLSCGGTSGVGAQPTLPIQIDDYRGCHGASTFDAFILVKKPDANGTLMIENLTYAFVPGIPFTPGQPLDLNFEWSSTPLVHVNPVITGLSAGKNDTVTQVYGSKGDLKADIQMALPVTSPATSSSTATFDWSLPGNVFDKFNIYASVIPDADTSSTGIRRRFSRKFWTQGPTPPSPSIDASSLAYVSGSTSTTDDLPHIRAKWSLEAGPKGDAITGSLSWRQVSGVQGYWTFFASPAKGSAIITMPDLPATFDKAYVPVPWTTVNGLIYLQHIDDDGIAGYSAYVATPPDDSQSTITSID